MVGCFIRQVEHFIKKLGKVLSCQLFPSTTTVSMEVLLSLHVLDMARIVALLVFTWKRRFCKMKQLTDDKNPKPKWTRK